MSSLLSRWKAWLCSHLFIYKHPEIQSELMSRLSHEIRTELTGIVGYAEFLEQGTTDPMMNFTATIIRDSGKSLTRTSQSFFDFYLLSQQQIRLKYTRFVFAEALQKMVAEHQAMAAAKEVTLVFSCANEASTAILSSDLDRMQQVLEAVIFDLLDANCKWSLVQVHLGIDEMRQELVVSFVSSGTEVAPAQIQLLKQFWNGDKYQFRLQEGPGVNLALAKAMIYFLNGTVEFQHSLEFPSRLEVRFPVIHRSFAKVFS